MTRDDLLREATALIERVELAVPGYDEPITAGFRRNGSPSFFFGADPVIQFNARGQLRRMYSAGRLIKADGGTLVSMERVRGSGSVELRSRQLSAEEVAELTGVAQRHLAALSVALQSATHRFLRQVPLERDVVERIREWLASHAGPPPIADSPNVNS